MKIFQFIKIGWICILKTFFKSIDVEVVEVLEVFPHFPDYSRTKPLSQIQSVVFAIVSLIKEHSKHNEI